MSSKLISKYDTRVPRYTSYPTAPHFHSGIDGETTRNWLQDLPSTQPLSLYVHIPFCKTICWFCGCHTRGANSYTPIAKYLETLKQEIQMVARNLATSHDSEKPLQPVHHLHFGGGSPSILSPQDFRDLVQFLKSEFDFNDDAEIAIELDPRTTTPELISAMAEVGVTRASVGVQDLTPEVQKAINRIQPFDMVRDTILGLKQAGILGINIDLMYGLPHQTIDNVCQTIKQITPLEPDRLAVFGYAHVPWMRKHQKQLAEDSLPGTDERWAQACAARDILVAEGYTAIGFDHFAHPSDDLSVALADGTLNRNFQGYTNDTTSTLIGFGVSGISELPQGYAINDGDLLGYTRSIEAGEHATRRGISVSVDDKARRAIIERLMCDLRVDVASIAAAYDIAMDELREDYALLDDMAKDGLLVREADIITLTETGRPFVRAACAAFDRYFRPGEKKHSKAV